jgi:hypothetical protein
MTKPMIKNNSVIFIRKTLAVILVGVFLFTNTLSWAKEERLFSTEIENQSFSSRPADNSKLAPPSKLSSEDFKYSLTVGAICKHVEHDGNLDDKSYLNDVLARLDAEKNHNITVLPYEITIEIPSEGLAIRYFDPTKANIVTPYSDISKLQTKIIGPQLHRQIIHRLKVLPLQREDKTIIAENSAKTITQYDENKLSQDRRSILEIFLSQPKYHTKYGSLKDVATQFSTFGITIDQYMEFIMDYIDKRHYKSYLRPSLPLKEEFANAPEYLRNLIIDIIEFSNMAYEQNEMAEDARRLLWKSGEREADLFMEVFSRNGEMRIFDQRFPLLDKIAQGKEIDSKPILDIASGQNIAFFMKSMTSGRYIVADKSFFIEAFLNRIKKRLGIGNNVEIRRVDVTHLEEAFSENEYKHIRLGNIDSYIEGLDTVTDFIPTLLRKVAHGGTISYEHQYPRNDIEYYMPTVDNIRKQLAIRTGWAEENGIYNDYDGDKVRYFLFREKEGADTNKISVLRSYLQTENYFYSLLTQEMQGRVVKRIVDLERVVIEIPDGTRRSITEFIKYVLAQYGVEDKLEHIIVFGSYIFSSRPSDIDFTIGLKGKFNQPELLDVLNKINGSNLIKDKSFKIIFPEGSDYAVNEAHFTFIGEGSHSYNRQDHLAIMHTLSGAVIYGDRISQSNIEPTAFAKRAVEEAKSLANRIIEKRTVAKLDSKKAVYRLLHTVLIISRVNPTLLETINPKDVYKFIKRYFSEEIDQHQRATQALQDLHDYLAPEKANSVYAYFLIPEVATLAENGDERSQIEAVEVLAALTGLGNIEAFKNFYPFSKIDNPQVQLAVKQATLKTKSILESNKGFKTAPEIVELNKALWTLVSQVGRKYSKNQTNYITAHQALFKDILGENKPDTLVRVPVEAIESVGIDNIKDFLATFQEVPNGYIELYYMSGIGEVSETIYQKYGLQKK